jgi:hypothetical protein
VAYFCSRWRPKVERVDHPKTPFLRQRRASYFAAGDSVVGFWPTSTDSENCVRQVLQKRSEYRLFLFKGAILTTTGVSEATFLNRRLLVVATFLSGRSITCFAAYPLESCSNAGNWSRLRRRRKMLYAERSKFRWKCIRSHLDRSRSSGRCGR